MGSIDCCLHPLYGDCDLWLQDAYLLCKDVDALKASWRAYIAGKREQQRRRQRVMCPEWLGWTHTMGHW